LKIEPKHHKIVSVVLYGKVNNYIQFIFRTKKCYK